MNRETIKEEREDELLNESDNCNLHIPQFLQIFDGDGFDQLPSGFNTVTIRLNGALSADLNWSIVKDKAIRAIQYGYLIMWEIDFGLFDRLTQPLNHQMQFLSFALCLEHFRDHLWKEFKAHTVGVSLYRGSLDFSGQFPWTEHQEKNCKEWLEDLGIVVNSLDQLFAAEDIELQQLIQLFCRDVAMEYLSLLATRLPDSLPIYLYLDASLIKSTPKLIQLLNPERFERFNLCLQGTHLPFEALGWNNATYRGYSGTLLNNCKPKNKPTIGLVVPPLKFNRLLSYEGIEEAIKIIEEHSYSLKFIAENHVTAEWDGLDFLIFSPNGLSKEGKRKLQGFCAAGGTVVSTGALTGLFPQEIPLSQLTFP